MAAIKGRKDSKGYVLRTGESQRNDGRYCYAYSDRNRVRHYIYAKTLPELRAREKELQIKYDQGLDAYAAKKLTLNDCFDRYISQKYNLKETTKTEAGTRTIPMIQEVYEAFLTEYEIQKCLGFCEEEIDGYSGFVFSTAYHTVYSAAAVNNAIHRATKAYNNKEEEEAKKEGREPLLLPDFSAHHLRHTFCTRLCENETNLKVICQTAHCGRYKRHVIFGAFASPTAQSCG